jgi:hypothetical protein
MNIIYVVMNFYEDTVRKPVIVIGINLSESEMQRKKARTENMNKELWK